MIGRLLAAVACPAAAVRAGRFRPLIGHRSWAPLPRVIDHGGADLDGWDPAGYLLIPVPSQRTLAIGALRRTKADPGSLRLTAGQRRRITGRP